MPGKKRSKKGGQLRNRRVFLNIPYSASYERLFVAMTTALVTVNAEPVLTFDISEVGEGRLHRILRAINQCRVSIHDLSYASGRSARFNMPFELGLAYALHQKRKAHDFRIMESREYRLQMTLSDLNGIEPFVHNRRPKK